MTSLRTRPVRSADLSLPHSGLVFTEFDAQPLDRATVVGVLLSIPFALLGWDILGFAIGGWAWSVVLGVGLMAVLFVAIPPEPLLRLRAYLLFIGLAFVSLIWTPDIAQGLQTFGKYLSVAVIYVVGWRVATADPDVLLKLRTWALVLLPSALLVFIRALGDGASAFGWIRGGNAARPMVMAVAILYLVSTVGRSRRFTIVVGAFALLVAIASGGRMGTAVIALLILLNPAMRLTWKTRVVLFAAGLAVFAAALQLEPIQERLFVGRQEGTLEDIVALEGNFNTAGRSNNWPAIIDVCIERPWIGHGMGSANPITLEATLGRTPHPHNEYLRLFCETGLIGTVLFWSLFVAVGWRGARIFLRTGDERGSLAALSVLAVLLFSATDNATIYTSVFMAPVALVIGVAEGSRLGRRTGGMVRQ